MRRPQVERAACGLLRVLVALSLTVAPAGAWAQTDDERAGARAAATQGGTAFSERRWADAIDLFSRAESLVHSPVHLLHIARSHVQLGQLVRAREVYIKLNNEILAADAPPVFKEAKADAEQELQQLEPRIPYVSVVVQGAGPKPVTVLMDGVQVPPALVGVPRPVNPGEHKFQAYAEGMESALNTVTVAEGRNETVVLTLQATASAPPPGVLGPAATPGAGSGAATGSGTALEADTGGGLSGMQVAGIVVGGVGVLGVVGGIVFTSQAAGKRGDADDICSDFSGDTEVCPRAREDEINDIDDKADSANTLSTVSFILGGVGIAAGVTLFVLGAPDKPSEGAVAVRPWIGPRSAGLVGRF